MYNISDIEYINIESRYIRYLRAFVNIGMKDGSSFHIYLYTSDDYARNWIDNELISLETNIGKKLYNDLESIIDVGLDNIYSTIEKYYNDILKIIKFNYSITSIAWTNYSLIKELPIYNDTNIDLLNNIENIIEDISNKHPVYDDNGSVIENTKYYNEVGKLFSNIYNIPINVNNNIYLIANYNDLIGKLSYNIKVNRLDSLDDFISYSGDIDNIVNYEVNISPYISNREDFFKEFEYYTLENEAKKRWYEHTGKQFSPIVSEYLKDLTKNVHKLCKDLDKADYNDLFDIAIEMELITMPEIMGLQRGVIKITKADICKRIKMMLKVQNEDITDLINSMTINEIEDIIESKTKKMKIT